MIIFLMINVTVFDFHATLQLEFPPLLPIVDRHVRPAVNALLATPSPPITTSTLNSLHQLHPCAKEPFPAMPVISSGIVIDAAEVASLPHHLVDNGSSPGPSGWTGSLLVPLLRDPV